MKQSLYIYFMVYSCLFSWSFYHSIQPASHTATLRPGTATAATATTPTASTPPKFPRLTNALNNIKETISRRVSTQTTTSTTVTMGYSSDDGADEDTDIDLDSDSDDDSEELDDADDHLLVVPHLTTPVLTKTEIADPSSPLAKVISMLQQMPRGKKPANLQKTLQDIVQGEQICKAIQQKKLYSSLPFSVTDPKVATALQLVFDGTDDAFWQKASQLPALKEEILRSNIPFTKAACSSKEYKMFFRMAYLRSVVTDPVMQAEIVEVYKNAVLKLQWFLFAQAILQEKQAFTSGMITCPDESNNMFYFMDGYCELVSPRYRSYGSLSPHSLWQTKAYTRKSSHWAHKKEFNDKNFGIDFLNADGTILSDLPGSKSHLLFGVLDNGHIFFKYEEYGVTLNIKEGQFSAVKHTLRYFQKRNKADGTLERRETVSKDVALNYNSYGTKPASAADKAALEKDGISAMLSHLRSDPVKHQAFLNFLTEIKQYDPETLHVRKGNEVIIKPEKFVSITDAAAAAGADFMPKAKTALPDPLADDDYHPSMTAKHAHAAAMAKAKTALPDPLADDDTEVHIEL